MHKIAMLVAHTGLEVEPGLAERGVAHEVDDHLVRRGLLRAEREPERGAERRRVSPAEIAAGRVLT